MRRNWRRTLGIAVGVAGALVSLTAVGGDREFVCGEEEGSPVHWFDFEGLPLRAIHGNRLVFDGITAVIPKDPRTQLRWTCRSPDWESVDYQPVEVGEEAWVYGTLQTDGTVLAHLVQPTQDSGGTYYGHPVASGPVEKATYDELGLASFVIDGLTFDASRDYFEITGGNDTYETVRPVLPGDVAAVSYRVADDGAFVPEFLTLRQAGDGTTVVGTTASDDEDAGTFVVDGVTCYYGDASYSYDLDLTNDAYPDWAIRAGRRVRVFGVLRDGIVVARYVHVLGDAPPASPAKRRNARLRANGIVDALHDGGATVSGLAVDARSRRVRVAPGDRVRVDARLRDGRAVSARIRRSR